MRHSPSECSDRTDPPETAVGEQVTHHTDPELEAMVRDLIGGLRARGEALPETHNRH